MNVTPGTVDFRIDAQVVDDNGQPVTGLLAATFPPVKLLWGANMASVTLHDLSDPDDPHADGGVLELLNGFYRLDLPDSPWAVAVKQVTVTGEDTNKHLITPPIQVGGNGPTIFLPGYADIPERSKGKLITIFTKEIVTMEIPVYGADGELVDLSAETLWFGAWSQTRESLFAQSPTGTASGFSITFNTLSFTTQAKKGQWALRANGSPVGALIAEGEFEMLARPYPTA